MLQNRNYLIIYMQLLEERDSGTNLSVEVSKMFTLLGDLDPLEIQISKNYKLFQKMQVQE
jgi:hypothetical protein